MHTHKTRDSNEPSVPMQDGAVGGITIRRSTPPGRGCKPGMGPLVMDRRQYGSKGSCGMDMVAASLHLLPWCCCSIATWSMTNVRIIVVLSWLLKLTVQRPSPSRRVTQSHSVGLASSLYFVFVFAWYLAWQKPESAAAVDNGNKACHYS